MRFVFALDYREWKGRALMENVAHDWLVSYFYVKKHQNTVKLKDIAEHK